MLRKTTARKTFSATTDNTVNQENNVPRRKVIDGGKAPLVQPPMRFALGDIKNNQQPMTRRTFGLNTTKIGDTTADVAKVDTRRSLRPSAFPNEPLPTSKNVEPRPVRAVFSKNASLAPKNSSTLLSTNNSSHSASGVPTLHDKANPANPSCALPSKVTAGPSNPRLRRSNAVTSHPTAPSGVSVSDVKNVPSKIPKQIARRAEIYLASIEEDSEDDVGQLPNHDNAYSSSVIPNIDQGDEEDPQFVAEYTNDIFSYLRALEVQQPIRENFLEGKKVNGIMRSILVDWLSKVHSDFRLLPETLYITVAMIDRFLQEVAIPKEKLQLLGVTAMFVATKLEETGYCPIDDFVHISNDSCSKRDIRVMECHLLRALRFKLTRPSPIQFLRRYSKAANANDMLHTLAKYFLELSLAQYALAHFAPSMMAAAALWLAMKLLNPAAEWSNTLIYYSGYQEQDFMSCFRRLCRTVVLTHTLEIKQQVIRKKFSAPKFLQVSKHRCL